MLRSLYSGVSGMRANQTKMDVIGNNISNSTTTAFKSGRVRFQDLFSQTMANASGPSATGKGGSNPRQVGLGVTLAAVDTIMTGGSLQSTGRDLDFGIENDGFFAVSSDSTGAVKNYTRDGAFFTDYQGNLVNSNGMRVLGYMNSDYNASSTPPYTATDTGAIQDTTTLTSYDPTKADEEKAAMDLLKPMVIPTTITNADNEVVKLESFSVDSTGLISGVYSDGNTYSLGRIGMVKFQNPAGLEKTGSNCYVETRNSGPVEVGIAGTSGFGDIKQGVLEMSNVDLANEFTDMIVTSRAYQANSKTITTSDEMLQTLLELKR